MQERLAGILNTIVEAQNDIAMERLTANIHKHTVAVEFCDKAWNALEPVKQELAEAVFGKKL